MIIIRKIIDEIDVEGSGESIRGLLLTNGVSEVVVPVSDGLIEAVLRLMVERNQHAQAQVRVPERYEMPPAPEPPPQNLGAIFQATHPRDEDEDQGEIYPQHRGVTSI